MAPRRDQAAEFWLAVYMEHRSACVRYALSLAGNADDAEDLVQEAIVRAMGSGRGRASAAGRGGELVHPRAYLLRCVRSVWIDRGRRASGEAMGGAGSRRELAVGFDEPRDAEARALLARLGDDDRELVILRLRSGLTFEEIAAVLDRKASSLRSRYTRAIAGLRELSEGAAWRAVVRDGGVGDRGERGAGDDR